MAEPRESTDQETAPLLRGDDENGSAAEHSNQRTFSQRLNAAIQEPISDLTKILLVLCLILLIISSVFVGLFAGAQHKLNKPNPPSPTLTATATATATSIVSGIPTTTVTATTTQVKTTTAPIAVPTSPPVQPPCLTSDCIVLSASILSSLDTSQDPCDNFYEFANGGWLAAHPLPADKGSFGQFEALARQNQQIVQSVLEKNYTIAAKNPDAEIIHKLQDLYTSCLAEDTLDTIGNEPVKKLVRTVKKLFYRKSTDISGNQDDDDEEKEDKKKEKLKHGLSAALAFMHSRGIDSLFSFSVEGDGLQPNLMSLWFSQPELGLPSKEYYLEDEITELYQSVIEELLLALDEDEDDVDEVANVQDVSAQTPLSTVVEKSSNVWPPWPWPPWGGDDGNDGNKEPGNKTERAKVLAKRIVKLEIAIANATLDLDILQEDPMASYNPLPLSNLTDTLPQIDFLGYFSTFAPRSFPKTVIQTYPPYASSLSMILSSTAPSTLSAYLGILTTLSTAPYLGPSTSIYLAHRRLVEALTGLKKGVRGDRGEECVRRVESALGFASGRLFVVSLEDKKKGVGEEISRMGRAIIGQIIDAFKDSLRSVTWMDKKSAKAAREKADALRVKVGYPLSPDTRDPNSIARYYSLVKIHKLDYFGNMMSAATSDEIKKWAKLGRPRNLDEWEMQPAMVNAYYNPPGNEIVFPVGILQSPFFSVDWPGYLNYGAFGMVAAHELTHAFDSAGRLYNQEGKLEEWWTNSTTAGFQVKKDCIVEQYSKYYIDDGKGGRAFVNGNLTSGENIGDSGLIQSYRAWKAQYPDGLKTGTEYILPGLDYTRDQLFFISFARVWARSMKPAAAVQRIRTDPHSPSAYRVDGTVSNIPEFAKAFNCSSKAKLNPPREKQCIFWS